MYVVMVVALFFFFLILVSYLKEKCIGSICFCFKAVERYVWEMGFWKKKNMTVEVVFVWVLKRDKK